LGIVLGVDRFLHELERDLFHLVDEFPLCLGVLLERGVGAPVVARGDDLFQEPGRQPGPLGDNLGRAEAGKLFA
jgi:hypothetical protein